MAGLFSREVARRIFAEELKSSNYSFRDGEEQNQYAPQYLLTPTGAKCNRVFIVATLTEKDDIGGDTEYWRGRLVDPTSSILIYAGQYQPEAAQILANMEAPAFVAVVGKPNLYKTEEGNIIISLRAESIQQVDEATRNLWVMDTARRTLERLTALKNAKPGPVCNEFATADKVPSSTPPPDAERALEHYHTDLGHFRQMTLRALSSLKADLAKNGPVPAKIEDRATLESESKLPLKGEPEEKAAPKKARGKKSESLNAWPEPENDEEVETFNLGKKS